MNTTTDKRQAWRSNLDESLGKKMKRCKMQWQWIGMALATALMTSAARAKPPSFAVPPISSFDGKSWGGFTLGETSRSEVKKRIRLSKHGRYPNSFEAVQEKNSPLQVDLLFTSRRDADAKLIGFIVRQSSGAPAIAELQKTIGAPVKKLYERGRFEDWYVAIYSQHGIAAFVIDEHAPLLALVAPPSLSALERGFSPQATPIVKRVDPHAGEPRIMYSCISARPELMTTYRETSK
jgi:hypothetical protein